MTIDITNRAAVNALLQQLDEGAEPAWGVMRPQNMVEHLAATIQFSNGKRQMAQRTSEQEGKAAKEAFLFTDVEMPKGLKSALLGDTVAPFEWGSLEEAIQNLNRELDDFEQYFAAHPEATFIHPRLGPLDHKEWIAFHGKHFTHHFRQFGLV